MGRKNKGDKAQTALTNQNRQQSDSYYNRVTGRYPQAEEHANQLWDTIYDRSQQGANTSPGDFESYGIFKGMTGPEGGLDPSRVSSIDENIAGFKDIGRTGGWSEQDLANTRLQASRVPTSIFAGLKQRSDQQRQITGGYAPSGDARMGREAARAAAEGVLNSDIDTAESVRQGKLQGLGGAQSAEMQLLNLITGQQRFGASGMAGDEGMALDANQGGLSDLLSLYSSSPGELDSLFGNELRGRGLDYGVQSENVGRHDRKDSERRDRKMRAAQMLTSGAATASTMGMGGGGLSMPVGGPPMPSGGVTNW